PVLQVEALDEGLERTVLAVMAELGAEHVERNALARGVGRVGEREHGLGVAESLDQPRRGDPVDVRARAGYPRAAARRQRPRASSGHGGPGLERAQALRRRLPQGPSPLARRRLEIVDRLDAV